MRIFDSTKTIELTEYDLTQGYLQKDTLEIIVEEQLPLEEQSYYIIVNEYPNGGQEVKKIIQTEALPYIPAHIQTEEIQVYIPYTEAELIIMQTNTEIDLLKNLLFTTDYQAIKYAEGILSLDEYLPMKQQRQEWRRRINELENTLTALS